MTEVEVRLAAIEAIRGLIDEKVREGRSYQWWVDLDGPRLMKIVDAVLEVQSAEVCRLHAALDEAQLHSIEARNPGIDMDEVRASRQRRAGVGDMTIKPLLKAAQIIGLSPREVTLTALEELGQDERAEGSQ